MKFNLSIPAVAAALGAAAAAFGAAYNAAIAPPDIAVNLAEWFNIGVSTIGIFVTTIATFRPAQPPQ